MQDAASGLVHLRARWYLPGHGTFGSRDPFAGFPTYPYSLHPYQYGYSNPVLWTDPSGECISWIWGSPTCKFAGLNPANWNYRDGATYATSVINTAVVQPIQSLVTFATSAEARSAAAQQMQYVVTHPQVIPGLIRDNLLDTYHNLYAGFVCDDMDRLGQGVVSAGGYITDIAGLTAAIRSLPKLAAGLRNAGQGTTAWWRAYNLEAQKLRIVPEGFSAGGKSLAQIPRAVDLTLSNTLTNHLYDIVRRGPYAGERARPFGDSRLLMQEIMDAQLPIPDPKGHPGFLRWDVPGSFRGSEGVWELVIDPKTRTVFHFNFTR